MDIPRNWTFKDAGVAEGFDHHVREQLPWYDLTTGVIAHIARHYIPENGLVYDIGASIGNIGNAIAETLKSRSARLVAIENSDQMADLYVGPGKLVIADATDFCFEPCDFVVCFLVLMFIKPRLRAALVSRLIDNLNPGGAMVIFDKCVPVNGYPSVVLQRLTLAGKIAAGVSAEEVVKKELSLGGVQRPLHSKELPSNAIEIFRFGDFAGWLIEKPIYK
jgi:tRNA (cmo5U34)-methyltransferase